MVAKITIPISMERTLRYNERKVEGGNAVYLGSGNCLDDARWMTAQKKIEILQHRNALNDRAQTKMIHISLNFGKNEKLSESQLRNIAAFYMERIGFGEQPFFIYQHHDAGHPHIHIVSTIIRQDGSRINTHNIGRNQSEGARKATEQYFGLLSNERKKQNRIKSLVANNAKRVVYGKEETVAGIASVLHTVLRHYNYTSLSELNAVLKQYYVVAERGAAKSKMRKYGGLCYRILNEEGKKTGLPIKASVLPDKPTLAYLEQQIRLNTANREALKAALEKTLLEVAFQNVNTPSERERLLNAKGITVCFEKDTAGELPQMICIDTKRKSAFSETELCGHQNVAAMLRRLKNDSTEIGWEIGETCISQVQRGAKNQPAKPVLTQQKKVPTDAVVRHSTKLPSLGKKSSTSSLLKNKSNKKQKKL